MYNITISQAQMNTLRDALKACTLNKDEEILLRLLQRAEPGESTNIQKQKELLDDFK